MTTIPYVVPQAYVEARRERMADTLVDYLDEVDGVESLLHDIVLGCREMEKYHSEQLARYARLRKLVS